MLIRDLSQIFWGLPTVCFILGTGACITIACRVPQVRLFPKAVRAFWKMFKGAESEDGNSSYRALCTALAATVGTGNIAGVAGALAIGGPGAVFWMWLSAFFGMATKYAESSLAVRYREAAPEGGFRGGTMFMILRALPKNWHILAGMYSLFGLVASFGVGNATQVHAFISALREASAQYGYCLTEKSVALIGLFLALVVAILVSGGARRIGSAAECLVPVAAGAYILVCIGALLMRWYRIPQAIFQIFQGAFTPEAVTGGAVGSLVMTMRIGVSRGVFTNEAGMGTASMAHAGADVAHPVEQGLMGIMEVFLDTILICTLTALVILTGADVIPYGTDAGAELTARSLSNGFGPWVSAFLCACLCLFALATILGWGLYAGRCAEYLLGSMRWPIFGFLQGVFVFLGSMLDGGTIWSFSELMNALMAFPNLITLLFLVPELRHLTIDYICGKTAAGGTYENFH